VNGELGVDGVGEVVQVVGATGDDRGVKDSGGDDGQSVYDVAGAGWPQAVPAARASASRADDDPGSG
jgi:hypothetical protein